MTTPFDVISNIGRQYLDSQGSVNNGDFINLIARDSNQFRNTLLYIRQVLLNSSRYIPIYDGKTYQLRNLTAINNPNIVPIAFSIFWLCTFALLFIFLIAVLIHQCCTESRCHSDMGAKTIQITRNKSNIAFAKKTWNTVLIFLVVIAMVMWVIFLCLLCIQQTVTNIKLSQNQTNSTNNKPYSSLSSAISQSFVAMANMYQVITKESLALINESVNNMSAGITNQIQSSIVEFSNSILNSFIIGNVFKDATALLNGLNIVVNSMTFIYGRYRDIFSSISQIKGQMSVHQKTISDNLPTICRSLSGNPSLQATCNMLQSQTLQTLVDTTQINTDSSVITLFLMQQFQVNITNITLSFQVVNSSFNANLNNIFQTSVNSINVNSYLTFIVDFWKTTIIPMVAPMFTSASSYSTNASSIMANVSTYENVTVILLIFIIFFTTILTLIAFFRGMVDDKCLGKCANFCVHFFTIFFSLIFAIVAIALILATIYINDQVCRQFNTTEGIALSDQIVNEKLNVPWQKVLKDISSSGSTVQINLMQPTNIISGINTRCRNSSIGLFYAIGMDNFVNISQVLQSGGISKTISDTQQKAWAAFVNVNPSQVIPNNLKGFLADAQRITAYFDSVNYTASIAQLSMPLVGIVDFATYFNSLFTFTQNAMRQLGNTNELVTLTGTASQLLQSISTINQTQNDMYTMRNNYQNLLFYRNNTQFIRQLTANLNDASVIFSNVTNMGLIFNSTFSQIISNNMLSMIIQIANTNLTSLTNKLVPCGNASLIYEALTTSLCSPNNMKDTLATVGLIIIMVVVTSQIITILTIISILFRLKFPKNVSTC